MPRVDKTESAIGVVRADLNATMAVGKRDTLVAVGLNTAGKLIEGAGNTGIIGVVIVEPKRALAGRRVDVFVLADIVECVGLAAGTTYWADGATGAIVPGQAGGAAPATGAGSTAGSTKIGFTVEADRLLVRL